MLLNSQRKTTFALIRRATDFFELLGQVDPALINDAGIHQYKCIGGVVLEIKEERVSEYAAMPKIVPESDPNGIPFRPG